MCLLLVLYRNHPSYDLILAANRDEYYQRPSLPPAFWDDPPYLLGGKDLVGGGTWLGITRCGRIAAITNYRHPPSFMKNAPSRGKLVSDFLLGEKSPKEYLNHIRQEADKFNGFNLVIGDTEGLAWFSNRNGNARVFLPGLYGISNHLLDTPWPKVERGKKLMASIIESEDPHPEDLFRVLNDRVLPADEMLPSTGVDLDWERILSPIFVQSPTYGTRSSTLIFIRKDGQVTFLDRTFDSGAENFEERRFEFVLEPCKQKLSLS